MMWTNRSSSVGLEFPLHTWGHRRAPVVVQGLLSSGRHGNCYLPYQTQPYSSTLMQTVIGSSVTGITRIKRAMMGGRRSFRTTSYVSMLPWITWRREVLISNFSLLCDSHVQGCNCTPSLQTGEISHAVSAEGWCCCSPLLPRQYSGERRKAGGR